MVKIVMNLLKMVTFIGLAYGSVVQADTAAGADFAVGPQYDTTHVYVDPAKFNQLVTSFNKTFGGTTSKQGVFQVTPTPSQTMSQLVLTPAGTISVFGFKTPIPYPFGLERTGYLVNNFDQAIAAARAAGADVIVAPFPDPIGRDAIIQWPGGVNMQIYWHTTPPAYQALQTIPENRIYVSPDKADAFIKAFILFAHGTIVADEVSAPGVEIGRPNETYRQVTIKSGFGILKLMVTDGHLPWPYGREMTGYGVNDMSATLKKATDSGASVLVQPFSVNQTIHSMVEFPGGYIAEIHAPASTTVVPVQQSDIKP